MLLRSDIELICNDTIKDIFKINHPVRDFLLKHPTKSKLIDNLIGELYRVENTSINTDMIAIKQIVKDMVIFFSKTALKIKEDEIRTDLQRVLDEREMNAKIDLYNELENQGEASVEQFNPNT